MNERKRERIESEEQKEEERMSNKWVEESKVLDKNRETVLAQ